MSATALTSQSVPVSKKTKLSDLIQYRLKVSTVDNRTYIGTLLAFDKHMNFVLSDCEEIRITKQSVRNVSKGKQTAPNEVKRNLGLIVLRGGQIVNLSIQSAPVTDIKSRIGLAKGRGSARPLKQPVSVKAKFQGFKK